MKWRSGWWRAAALIFAVGNVAAAIYHVAIGEAGQSVAHAGVAAGTFLLWLTVFSPKREPEYTAAPQQIDSHLDHLQQSLDAIALEVERVGEGQRFAQKVLEDRRAAIKPSGNP